MLRLIHVAFKRELIHYWPDAPSSQRWLGHPHLHEFRVKALLEVEHNDREVEFYALRDELAAEWDRLYGGKVDGFQRVLKLSCEHFAEEMLEFLRKNYPGRRAGVWVFECEEFGAYVGDRMCK